VKLDEYELREVVVEI